MQVKFVALRTMNSFVLVQLARTIAPRMGIASKVNVPAIRDSLQKIVLNHFLCLKMIRV